MEATTLCSQGGLAGEPDGARCAVVGIGAAPSLPNPATSCPAQSPAGVGFPLTVEPHRQQEVGKDVPVHPGVCPALLLPGKQSSRRRRILSSMAVLKPRERALLGAAHRVPFNSVCPVSPPVSQRRCWRKRLRSCFPTEILVTFCYKTDIKIISGCYWGSG